MSEAEIIGLIIVTIVLIGICRAVWNDESARSRLGDRVAEALAGAALAKANDQKLAEQERTCPKCEGTGHQEFTIAEVADTGACWRCAGSGKIVERE